MSADCLKLTAYFGERDRSGGRLLADRLLDVFGERRVAASVLLRGAVGFGGAQQLRTDALLSLSEDLPAVAVAVDTRARIESMLEQVVEVVGGGLVTLERAQLLGAASSPVELPARLHEAAKLTVYVGRGQRVGGRPAMAAVCALLHRRGVAGASALLGVDGTRAGRRARGRFFARNPHVPVMIIAVGAGPRIGAAIPELTERFPDTLLTLERVRVCKRDGELLGRPHELPAVDEHGRALWQKLMVYWSQAAVHGKRPLSLEMVRRLRERGAAGATSLRGVWGFHGNHTPHGDKLLQLRRHVPVCTIAIDTPQRSTQAFAVVDELTAEQGLVTSEMVPALSVAAPGRCATAPALATHDF
ncbi:MAG TPA: DUF190 domain-containing protein [Solirubrobacteraceae bacterium]|nr:DUF190 domain-containing protein [Solirubrobacteraceae bacterium]